MAGHRKFDIAFVGLKPGKHEFSYLLDQEFFADYQEGDYSAVAAEVKLTLDKKNGFMMLQFDVGGHVQASCDRCGNDLKFELWDEFKLLVKLVDDADAMNAQESDPDVFYINRNESHLHLADWLYEFVTLSIPSVKICADPVNGTEHCNPEVLEKLKKLSEQQDKPANDIWKGLEHLKGLKD